MPARFFFVPKGKQAIKEASDTPSVVLDPPQHQSVVETAAASRKLLTPKSVLAGVLGILIVLLIYVLRNSSAQPDIQQFGRTRAIQLEVQNGAGEAKLAQKLTEYLRDEGFDVVEMGNYK